MDRKKLLGVLKKLALPKGEYVVFGGSVLVVHGLRKGDDIDLFVSRRLYEQLRDGRGWHEQWPKADDPPLLEAIIDGVAVHAFHDWQNRDRWQPDVYKIIKASEAVEGFPFMSLQQMYEWKKLGRRYKDQRDVRLIDRSTSRHRRTK